MRLLCIEPTVFFLRGQSGLRQLVRLLVDNPGPERAARLVVVAPGVEESSLLGPVRSGQSRVEVTVPDWREPVRVRFELWADGQRADARELEWQPAKHWEVHLVHTSHHDLGYTDLPSNVLREHDRFFEQVLEFCQETDSFPEDSRFRYSVEQAWSVLHFLENAQREKVTSLVRLMRAGRVEVTALFGNETSELCSHEEQVRLLYPSWRIRRRWGIAVETAELNDIPGISWGLVSVLAGAGIRYFAPMVPDYFRWGFTVHPFWDEEAVLPRDLPGAFWWQGPNGRRVLFWYGGTLWLWDYEHALAEVEAYLSQLERRGYPHELVRVRFQGGQRDNSPPDIRLSLIVRQWNERWAFPRLIVSTNALFFRRFEVLYGSQLRTLRGDLPNTDYTVGAVSTAKETGINRLAHETIAAAERFAAFASALAGCAYPADVLAEAWDAAMLYDEHTWGMSQCYGPAQEACFSQKGQNAYRAAALGHNVLVKSTNRIADGLCLGEDGYYVAVFNPLSFARSDVVRALFHQQEPCSRPMYWQPSGQPGAPAMLVSGTAVGRNVLHLPARLAAAQFALVDVETGKQVRHQVLPLGGYLRPCPFAGYRAGLTDVDPGHGYELVFWADNVPACGYRLYRLVEGEEARHECGDLCVGEYWLENSYYRLELDPRTGAVASLWDKELGRELVDAESARRLNQLVVRRARTGEEVPFRLDRVEIGAKGPLCASLLVYGSAEGCPEVVQEILLYSGVKRVEFLNRVLRDSAPLLEVYFAFPFAVPQPQFSFEGPNSVVRPIVDQLPGSSTDSYCVQYWVRVANEDVAVCWSSAEAPVVTLGEIWPGYVSQAHHAATTPQYGHDFLRDPSQFGRGHVYSYAMANNFRTNFSPVQVSDCLFRYALTSAEGLSGFAPAVRFGWSYSNPLLPTYLRGPQRGQLPPALSLCSVEPETVELLAAKAAEDGDGLVLRLYEASGRDCEARVELPLYRIEQAFRTNLVEEDDAVLRHDGRVVRIPLRAFEHATVRLRGCRFQQPTRLFYW